MRFVSILRAVLVCLTVPYGIGGNIRSIRSAIFEEDFSMQGSEPGIHSIETSFSSQGDIIYGHSVSSITEQREYMNLNPVVASLYNGGFVVLWVNTTDLNTKTIVGKVFHDKGGVVGPGEPFELIVVEGKSDIYGLSVTGLVNGDIAVTWAAGIGDEMLLKGLIYNPTSFIAPRDSFNVTDKTFTKIRNLKVVEGQLDGFVILFEGLIIDEIPVSMTTLKPKASHEVSHFGHNVYTKMFAIDGKYKGNLVCISENVSRNNLLSNLVVLKSGNVAFSWIGESVDNEITVQRPIFDVDIVLPSGKIYMYMATHDHGSDSGKIRVMPLLTQSLNDTTGVYLTIGGTALDHIIFAFTLSKQEVMPGLGAGLYAMVRDINGYIISGIFPIRTTSNKDKYFSHPQIATINNSILVSALENNQTVSFARLNSKNKVVGTISKAKIVDKTHKLDKLQVVSLLNGPVLVIWSNRE